MSKAALHAVVNGRVQGVYFRAFVDNHAVRLGLTGFVRNLSDGQKVEVVAEGDKDQLEKLLGYIRSGPPRSMVEDVAVHWSEASGQYPQFNITY